MERARGKTTKEQVSGLVLRHADGAGVGGWTVGCNYWFSGNLLRSCVKTVRLSPGLA